MDLQDLLAGMFAGQQQDVAPGPGGEDTLPPEIQAILARQQGRPPSFRQRFAPAEQAVADGTFDPQGMNNPSPTAMAGIPGGATPGFAKPTGGAPPLADWLKNPEQGASADPTEAMAMAPTGNPMGLGPPGPQPEQSGGGLLAALGIKGPQKDMVRGVMATLGGGLANVKNSPFAGQTFANAMGGGLQAGERSDNVQDALKLHTLDRALKAKQIADTNAFRQGSLGIAQQNADSLGALRQAGINRPGAWNKPPAQIMLQIDNQLQRAYTNIDKANAAPFGEKPDQALARQQRIQQMKDQLRDQTYQKYGFDPKTGQSIGAAPGVPGGGAPTPKTQQEFDALPDDAPYMRPGDPKVYYKRPRTGAGSAPLAQATTVDDGNDDDETP